MGKFESKNIIARWILKAEGRYYRSFIGIHLEAFFYWFYLMSINHSLIIARTLVRLEPLAVVMEN